MNDSYNFLKVRSRLTFDFLLLIKKRAEYLLLTMITSMILSFVNAQPQIDTSQISNLRQQAIDSLFGYPHFSNKYVKEVIFKLAKSGDVKSKAWQAIFHNKKALGYQGNYENAKFWINYGTYRQLYQLAMQGDPESMYLFANLLIEGIWPPRFYEILDCNFPSLADSLFKASAKKKYPAAEYYLANQQIKQGNYQIGIESLLSCYKKGMGKAGMQLLLAFQNNSENLFQSFDMNRLNLDSICEDLINRGSTDAELYQAQQYLQARDNKEANRRKGLFIIENFIRQNDLSATLLMADYLLTTEDATYQNIKVVNLLKDADNKGMDVNGEAKFKLAILYLKSSQVEQQKEAIKWLYKAANDNHVDACYLLSQFLKKGTPFITADPIMSQYWAFKGWSSLLPKAEDIAKQQDKKRVDQARMELAGSFLSDAFWNYKPIYTKSTYYNTQTGAVTEKITSSDFGSDMVINLLITAGILGVFDHLFSNPDANPSVSSFQLVKSELTLDSTATAYTYFVTVNGSVEFPVQKGDEIHVMTNGTGVVYARGGYLHYSLGTSGALHRLKFRSANKDFRWGALMIQFNKGDYMYAGGGVDQVFSSPKDGRYKILINDKDNAVEGAFALRVKLIRKNR